MLRKYSLYDDIDLVNRVQGQTDHLAFEEIYRRYARYLLEVAYRKTGSKEVAEEIVQITFVRFWANRLDLKVSQSLKAYLYTAVKNNVTTYYYRKLSKRMLTLDAIDENLPSAGHGAQNHLQAKQLNEVYQQSVAALPEKCRQVFRLSRAGYSLKEIADIQNISTKTAEAHITKALQFLRQRFKEVLFLFLLVLESIKI